ncbi:MAG: serine--tRNA ligase, partial [Clostridiales Family XIII bacterium]|nr:serine--tRNA ligase [Clostridiales Family XIII bacterium]
MIDQRKIRENYDAVKDAVESRGHGDFGLPRVQSLDVERRELLSEVEKLKNRQNVASKEIPRLKKEGRDAGELLAEMKTLSEEIKTKDGLVAAVEDKLKDALLNVPNTPHPDVPIGADDGDNREVRKVGEPKKFDFAEKAHWDIGTDLNILDFERAAKIAGARFAVYKGLGARLERSVINFMLNLHTEKNGYTEVLPPFMVNRDAMTGTGQLPKFEEDMFHIPAKDFFLIPTAEVPVTNLLRDEILNGDDLPIY